MKSVLFRAGRAALLLFVVVFLMGCVKETRHGDSVKYTYEWWVPISILLGSVVGIVGGWFVRSLSERFGWGLIVIGVIGIFVGPSMIMDYTIVDGKHCEMRTGLPFLASKEEVAFDDVQSVELSKEVRRGRRGRRTTSYYLNFHLESGQTVKMQVNGHLREDAGPLIIAQLAVRGIPVSGDFEE